MGYSENPLARFLPRPPFLLASSLPVRAAVEALLGFYDQRIFDVLSLLLALLIVAATPADPGLKRMAVALIGLNHYTIISCINGETGVAAALPLAAACWAFARKRGPLGGALLGVAALSDLVALSVLPFYAAWAVRRRTSFRPLLLIAAVVLGPFLLWDFYGTLSGLVLYPNAIAPIQSEGVGGIGVFLLYFGGVSSPSAAFPFGWVRVGLGIALAIGLWRRQREDSSTASVLENAFLFGLLLLTFASRAFALPHLACLFAILGLWLVSDRRPRRTPSRSPAIQ